VTRLILLMAAGVATQAGAGVAQQRDSTAKTLVTAVTMGTIYVGAGRADGVREGTVLRVPRLGDRASYAVRFLASKSAAARGDSLAPLPQVGDTVVYTAVIEQATTTAYQPGTTGKRKAGPPLRGRIGIRYLGSWERASDVSMRQPGIELLLDGPITPGGPVGVNLDIRSRRTSVLRPGSGLATTGVLGVYQAAIRIQPKGAFRAMLGRQYAPVLAGVGLYDGALLEVQKPTWGVGLMAGIAPDPGSLALSSDTKQAGFFVQGRNQPLAPVRWSLTFGAMGSYVKGEVNREFGFVQGTFGTRAVSVLALQEVDLNRGWKVEAGEPRLGLTSTFVSVTVTPLQSLYLQAGLDSRRNVRLYRDLVTPEEVFDDRFRQGYWAGATLTIAKKLRIGSDVRTNRVSGADSLGTTAISVNASADGISPAGLGFRFRGTRYTVPLRGQGSLGSAALRFAPPSLGALELNGGLRTEGADRTRDRFWAGASAELFVRRSWFFLLTFTREWGRDGLTPTTDLLYGGLSYRF
jgi:hypothetical protein